MEKHCRPKPINAQTFMREMLEKVTHLGARVDESVRLSRSLVKKGDLIMANLQEVKDELAGLKSDIAAERAEVQANTDAAKVAHDEALAEIKRLSDLIAAGTTVTVEDLDGLKTSVMEARASVVAISEAVPPPAEP